MTEVVAETLVFERMESWLFGIFAALALALALVGLYGLVSHEVEAGQPRHRRPHGAGRGLAAGFSIWSCAAWRGCWGGTMVGLVLTLIARRLIGMVIYFDAGKRPADLCWSPCC